MTGWEKFVRYMDERSAPAAVFRVKKQEVADAIGMSLKVIENYYWPKAKRLGYLSAIRNHSYLGQTVFWDSSLVP